MTRLAQFRIPVIILLICLGMFTILKAAEGDGLKQSAPLEQLIGDLSTQDNSVWQKTADELVKMGKTAVPSLIGALQNADSRVKCRAATVLGIIGDARAVDGLIAVLNDSDQRARLDTALALGKIGDRRAVEPLIRSLKDTDWGVRSNAATALGMIKDSRAVEPLIANMTDKTLFTMARAKAALALGEIGGTRSVEALIEAMNTTDDSMVKSAAPLSLGKIRDSRAVEALINELKKLKASEEDCRKSYRNCRDVGIPYVVDSLSKLTGANFGSDPKKWNEYWEKNKDSFK